MSRIKLVHPDDFKARAEVGNVAGLGVRKNIAPKFGKMDGEKLGLSFTISDETLDRDGDIIRVKGWQLQNYELNPVVLWAHDSSRLPIATSRVRVDGKRLVADAIFTAQDLNPFGFMVFRLYENGFMHATSVGFDPKDFLPLDAEAGPFGGFDFLLQELLEWSCVPVGSNPNALQNAAKDLIRAHAAGIDTNPMRDWTIEVLDEKRPPRGLTMTEIEAAWKAVSKRPIIVDFGALLSKRIERLELDNFFAIESGSARDIGNDEPASLEPLGDRPETRALVVENRDAESNVARSLGEVSETDAELVARDTIDRHEDPALVAIVGKAVGILEGSVVYRDQVGFRWVDDQAADTDPQTQKEDDLEVELDDQIQKRPIGWRSAHPDRTPKAPDGAAKDLVTRIQAAVFDLSRSPVSVNDGNGWTRDTAEAWLVQHELSADSLEETGSSFIAAQFDSDVCTAEPRNMTEGQPVGVELLVCDVEAARSAHAPELLTASAVRAIVAEELDRMKLSEPIPDPGPEPDLIELSDTLPSEPDIDPNEYRRALVEITRERINEALSVGT